jgi:hypothetical protein
MRSRPTITVPGFHGLSRRQRTCLTIHGALVLVGAVGFLALAPASDWHDVWVLGALLALGVIAELADVALPTGIRLNATGAAALIALGVGGAGPAFAVLAVPLLAERLIPGRRLLRAGNLANLAASMWAALIGAGVLAAAAEQGVSFQAAPALFAAGVAMAVTTQLVGPSLYGPLWCGYPAGAMLREFRDSFLAEALTLALAAATAALIPVLGVFALAGFVVIVVVPQLAVAYAGRSRPVDELDCGEAMQLYAAAIADVLGAKRSERLILTTAAGLLADQEALAKAEGPPAVDVAHAGTEEVVGGPPIGVLHEAFVAAFHVTERWDGRGGPAGLYGDWTPWASRVLAVARAWSELTARETQCLSHAEALLDLAARADTEFDPDIVEAAGRAVDQERAFVGTPSFQPRLQELWGPWQVRRRVVPVVLAQLAPVDR